MPREVKWLKTLEGVPLAFPDVASIKAGETAWLDDAAAERAIAAGLAVAVKGKGKAAGVAGPDVAVEGREKE